MLENYIMPCNNSAKSNDKLRIILDILINNLNLDELKKLKNEISVKINLKETKKYSKDNQIIDLYNLLGQSRIV